jgi:hypothetical protein
VLHFQRQTIQMLGEFCKQLALTRAGRPLADVGAIPRIGAKLSEVRPAYRAWPLPASKANQSPRSGGDLRANSSNGRGNPFVNIGGDLWRALCEATARALFPAVTAQLLRAPRVRSLKGAP